MLKIHILQHVPFETSGAISEWIRKRNHIASLTRFYKNEKLPRAENIDWLVVMGGPMGVEDENRFPWMKEEKRYIKNLLEKGKKVIGICLGAQLIAEALGSKVYSNKRPEIGWWPVFTTKASLSKKIPASFLAFHWHGQTFDIPKNANRLFANSLTPNQGFSYKNQALALQFHIETTIKTMQSLISHEKPIKTSDFVQDEREMFLRQNVSQANSILFQLLDLFEGDLV